ncbi:mercuric ion transport protein [Methylomarinovum caldicuralii]|uniref:Mercuric transport protein MerT n=1 Tax=Methylomarinovum caldicuralii TaxID=438856 RepID=A0AAU9CW39_9GAMM|nr:mercuric ion transport protein [Methylomarinovum caldicuralii]
MATEMQTGTTDAEKTAAPKWFGVGAVLAAVGASLCCVGPFVLVLLGVGGSWMSSLVALSPYRPLFIVLTLVLLGGAFYRLYLQPCGEGAACASAQVRRRQRWIFWILSVAILALIAFPWYAPWFLD